MNRGNLVIYDETGRIFSQTGEVTGDVPPHILPVGLPFIELQYGTTQDKYVVRIDVETTPHTPIFESYLIPKTPDQLEIERLTAELEALKGGSV